jgi:hypothetical protein
MYSSEAESTASDMSDLSYEQELGEVGECGEVDEGPLQHCRKLTRLTRKCPSLLVPRATIEPRANPLRLPA